MDDVSWREGPGGEGGEQPRDFRDGQRDHSGLCRRCLVRGGWRRGLGAGAAAELGGGDGADREGGHDEHSVAQDRGVEPDLRLVQAEAVLAEFKIFFNRPLLIPVK